MTAKLPVVRAREVIRVAERLGFVLDRQKGSHADYRRPSDGARVVIPIHPGKDLKPKTLAGIVEDLGIPWNNSVRCFDGTEGSRRSNPRVGGVQFLR